MLNTFVPKATETFPQTGPVTLQTLLGDNASTRAIKSGEVSSDLIRFEFADYELAHDGFKPMVRDGAFDFGELAIVTFLQAKAYGKPLVLLPAPVSGRFQHHCLAYNKDVKVLSPANLSGTRIGVRSYTQTTGAWVRGILQNEYGVDPDKVTWVTFEDPHLAEYTLPPNVERAPKGKKLTQMLFDGEIDAALMGSTLPDDPRIQTVIPEAKKAALEWHARTGAIPMNHMAVVRPNLSQQRPDVVRELYRMMRESRDANTKLIDGIQTRPHGVEALRPGLEMIVTYAFQQKLIPRRLTVDELFDDTTRALGA